MNEETEDLESDGIVRRLELGRPPLHTGLVHGRRHQETPPATRSSSGSLLCVMHAAALRAASYTLACPYKRSRPSRMRDGAAPAPFDVSVAALRPRNHETTRTRRLLHIPCEKEYEESEIL
jgi:hypothetical protein